MGIHQDRGEPWRKWYKTARWKRLRLRVFIRDHFTCQCGCSRIEGNTSLLVADHKKPHRGSEVLFWDEANIQTMGKPCHDGLKQKAEQASLQMRGQWDFADNTVPFRQSGSALLSVSSKMARPSWFRRSFVPVTLVCGPPGAGKSTYVRRHAGPSDRVICFDEIATALFGRPSQTRPGASLTSGQIADVLRVRNEAIADLMRAAARDKWSKAWIILTEPTGANRQWWADVLGAEVIVIPTPAEECVRRIAADKDGGDDRGTAVTPFVAQWWGQYTAARCDRVLR